MSIRQHPSATGIRAAFAAAALALLSAAPSAHALEDTSGVLQELVGAGSGLLAVLLVGAVYVVAFGFFLYLGSVVVGVRATSGEASGAAMFLAIFTVVLVIAYEVLRLRMDPQMLKLALVAGLALAGPMAVKTTMGQTFWTSTKIFAVAALLTGVVMAILLGLLRSANAT